MVTPRKLNGNFFCSWGVIFMVYPFHSPDLLLPVICINNGKFSSVCTLLWTLVGVVIISGKTCSKTTRTSLLAQKKHRDSVSWWVCLVTLVSTWTEIAHAHEFGVLTDTPGDGAANFWWPSKVSKDLAVCGVLAVPSLP